jgi:hypothetical protein
MRTFFFSLGILGGVFLLATARADQPGDAQKPQPAVAESLQPGEYVGRLGSVNAKGNEIVLQLPTQRQVLKNPSGPTRTFDQIVQDVGKETTQIGQLDRNTVISSSLAEYKRKQEEHDKAVAKFQKNLPKQLNEFQQQLENPQPVEYVTLTERKDVPLTTAKDVKVRVRDLPTIDEDGHVHHSYSSTELRALKGKEPNEPGFDGKLRNLNAGEYVRVTLSPKLAEKKGEDANQPPRTEVTSIVVISKDQAEKLQPVRP